MKTRVAGLLAGVVLLASGSMRAAGPEPIVYTISVPNPASHIAAIDADIPIEGRRAIDVMMAIWSPGFYKVEDYATRVQSISAHTAAGPQPIVHTAGNRWRVTLPAGATGAVTLSYTLLCNETSVTTNWVGADYAVLTGPATFITLVETAARPHDVHFVLPTSWPTTASGLPPAPGGRPNTYRASDFETLADSPFLAGKLGVRAFTVDGKIHQIVSAGDVGAWDGAQTAADLQKIVAEARRFWGFELPYDKYAFLLLFRQGGGGLEHKNSALVTSSPAMGGSPDAYRRWVGLMSHEYFHAFNVKRLRPAELGPFDFEHAPTTTSLWISEGVTSYYGGLMVRRAGLNDTAAYLASLSSQVDQLQTSPGRLLQTLEQSSADVWNNSLSGVNPAATTVSYYGKGLVVGWLLDAHIRHLTNDRQSFDDGMRLAYQQYSGARGFTPEQFRAVMDTVAGAELQEWFRKAIASTEELDYAEALDWFGLRFAPAWRLEVRPDASEAQRAHLRAWLSAD